MEPKTKELRDAVTQARSEFEAVKAFCYVARYDEAFRNVIMALDRFNAHRIRELTASESSLGLAWRFSKPYFS